MLGLEGLHFLAAIKAFFSFLRVLNQSCNNKYKNTIWFLKFLFIFSLTLRYPWWDIVDEIWWDVFDEISLIKLFQHGYIFLSKTGVLSRTKPCWNNISIPYFSTASKIGLSSLKACLSFNKFWCQEKDTWRETVWFG